MLESKSNEGRTYIHTYKITVCSFPVNFKLGPHSIIVKLYYNLTESKNFDSVHIKNNSLLGSPSCQKLSICTLNKYLRAFYIVLKSECEFRFTRLYMWPGCPLTALMEGRGLQYYGLYIYYIDNF